MELFVGSDSYQVLEGRVFLDESEQASKQAGGAWTLARLPASLVGHSRPPRPGHRVALTNQPPSRHPRRYPRRHRHPHRHRHHDQRCAGLQ